jgi:hypothetical protein
MIFSGVTITSTSLAPTPVIGKNVGILDARARLGHHLCHRVPTNLVMSGLLVSARIRLGAINLDQLTLAD